MEKADNEILKKTLRHYIDLEYYANGVAEDLDELLEALYKNCDNAILASDYLKTKADYNAVHSAMEDYFSDFQTELNDRLEKEAETVKENECDFLSMLYGAALTMGAIATSRVLFAPFDGCDTVKTFAERSVKNIRRTYDTAVRSGYMFGQSSEDVREQAGRNLKQITRWINNGITTAIPSFAKTTDRIVFLNNDVEVVYCAVLDGRTCIVCGNNHGLHFKSLSVAPSIPVHANCRCVYLRATDVTEPMPTYEEYIGSLDDEEQLHILGRNRYDLWKNYGIELRQFVNNGSKLRLDEIEISANIKQNIALKENMKKAKEMFPNEIWEEKYKNVFVAKGRNPVNKHQQMVFEKEFATAKIASDNGHIVYMLPEKSANKNPDTLMDGVLTDLKKVTGNIKTIGSRFVEGMKQGKNCYMQIESDYTIEQIRNKLKGEKNTHKFTDGKVYIYLEGIEYSFEMNEL